MGFEQRRRLLIIFNREALNKYTHVLVLGSKVTDPPGGLSCFLCNGSDKANTDKTVCSF